MVENFDSINELINNSFSIDYTKNIYNKTSYNLTSNVAEAQDNFKLKLSIVVGVIYSFTFIVGLIGNLLVVLTILLHKRMRNSTNLIILNLAIADLIFIIFCVPFTGLNYVLNVWYFGKS
jgi:allatostatin receptor